MNRKEAITVVKNNWPHSSYTMLREALKTLIPELNESEDERIRKELMAFLKENLEKGGNAEETWDSKGLERWIAWLEKQGEQNSLKIAKFKVGDTLCRKGYTDHIVTDIYDKCEIPVYICNTDEGESHINFTDQEKWKLKPYWKPSEDQIRALRNQLDVGSVSWGEDVKLLNTLYADLMKLRGVIVYTGLPDDRIDSKL